MHTMLRGDEAGAQQQQQQPVSRRLYSCPSPCNVCSLFSEASVTGDCFGWSETIRSRRTTVMDYFPSSSTA